MIIMECRSKCNSVKSFKEYGYLFKESNSVTITFASLFNGGQVLK